MTPAALRTGPLVLGLVLLAASCAAPLPPKEEPAASHVAVVEEPKPAVDPNWLVSAGDLPVYRLSVDSPDRQILMADYAQRHYGLENSLLVDPVMIVVHTTAIAGFKQSFEAFRTAHLTAGRQDIKSGGDVNVGVHYLVAPDGTLAQLLPLNQMGRHAVGYNHVSFGIEIAGRNNSDITNAQIRAVVQLIQTLHQAFPGIQYVIGHHEYMNKTLDHFKYFRDHDTAYQPPKKVDPGARVMAEIRRQLFEDFNLVFRD